MSAQSRWLPRLGSRPSDEPDVDPRSLKAIAALLLLAQMPHLLHLPVWVSLSGAALVALRLWVIRKPDSKFLKRALSPLLLTAFSITAALLIKAHYGYFLGRDPSVAFLFLLVAAKFGEIRRGSDATLLLCLAAFLLLTQYFYSQTILSALVTLPAVLALGHAFAVLRDPENPVTTSSHLKLIAKMLLQGAPLAALLFVVFPRLPGPLWSIPEDAMATSGLSDSMAPGDIGLLSQSDAVAFRVDFDDAPPPNRALYWRGPVLDTFDGRRWSASKPRLDNAHVSFGNKKVLSYSVMLQPHRQRWFFALDQASSLPRSSDSASGKRRPMAHRTRDGQLLTRDPVTQMVRYRQESVLSDEFVPSSPPSATTLQLAGKNPRTVQLAERMRAEADNEFAYAASVLQKFNQQNYRYTLSPQLLGDSPVDEFLFNTREGFCEHYASAFVVMMRAAAIPARVVTGYQGGEINEDYMIVRQSDAHAWAEAFIDGSWRRFDPTGAVAPSRVEVGVRSAISSADLALMTGKKPAWLRDMQLRWDAMNHHWQRLIVDFDNDSQSELWDKIGIPEPKLWQLMVVVLVCAALWCFMVLGIPWHRNKKLAPAERAWLALTRMLAKKNLTREPLERPAEFLNRCARNLPGQSERLSRLRDDFEQWRFMPSGDSEKELESKIKTEMTGLRFSLIGKSRL